MLRLSAPLFGLLGCSIAAGFLAAGCATEQFKYVPSEHPSANNRVHDEAIYSVPPGSPEGALRIVSNGIEDVKMGPGTKSSPALHIQVAVSNKLPTGNWTLRAREQSVSFPGSPKIFPMEPTQGSADQQLQVAPGELRVADLYFALPETIRSSSDLQRFDFHWMLRSGDELVQDTTLFDRVKKPEYDLAANPFMYYPFNFGMGWRTGPW